MVLAYLIYYYTRSLPDFDELRNYSPPSTTRIYSSDGHLIREYSQEKRIFIPINKIPTRIIQAFIAAEDKNFFAHQGIDLLGLFRALLNNIKKIYSKTKMEGGSTITQQLVKNLLLSSEQSIKRKIQEAILSYMVSKSLSKERILELYMNQVYLGNHSYGVTKAAQSYFDKSLDQLTIGEAAFLAGLPKAPNLYNPEKHYERALNRRNYVIYRMLQDGYISKNSAIKAQEEKIITAQKSSKSIVEAGFFADKVSNKIIEMYGEETLYQGGLTVITTLDPTLQHYAEKSLQDAIEKYDRSQNYRNSLGTIKTNNWHKELLKISAINDILDHEIAVILSQNQDNYIIGLKNGKKDILKYINSKWNGLNVRLLNGQLLLVKKASDGNYKISQIPEVNGALMAMEPKTGKVLAQVGGYSYTLSKFNRATSALRQPGSAIKPFVYLAALEDGLEPNTIFEDAPITIQQGPNQKLWKPKNYADLYLGNITMRKGFERSRNIITVKVALEVGIAKIMQQVKKFRIIPKDKTEQHLSTVLGAMETTLEKLTNAYNILASQGIDTEPQYIEMIQDRKGNVIYSRNQCKLQNSHNPKMLPKISSEKEKYIIDSDNAYQIISMMQGVISRGSGKRAATLVPKFAGKTGSTNNSLDVWFIGFSPNITVGTYMGYDQPKTLGKYALGANLALPIFIDFIKKIDLPNTEYKPPKNIEILEFKDPITKEIYKESLKKNISKTRKKKNDTPYIINPEKTIFNITND